MQLTVLTDSMTVKIVNRDMNAFRNVIVNLSRISIKNENYEIQRI